MAPLVGSKELEGGIERCSRGHEDDKQRGIERWDIVEMNNMALTPHKGADDYYEGYEGYEDEEDDEVGIGEGGDEDGDWVVGHHLVEQGLLCSPSELRRCSSNHHPDGVAENIEGRGKGDDVGNNERRVVVGVERVDHHSADNLLGLLTVEHEGVGGNEEVVVL